MHTMLDDELKTALKGWWETGTTGSAPEGTDIPNPLFAATLSEHGAISYTTHPILGYHLAAAETYFAETSPLKSTKTEGEYGRLSCFVAAARAQFTAWVQSFIQLPQGQWTIEFAAADCLALCHTLQHHNATGQLSANLYRRQLSSDQIVLDETYQGPGAYSQFDVIETSDLWDECGGLNVLVSAVPLLKNEAWATMYTKMANVNPDKRTRELDQLLCAPFKTVSTLLGISPQEYWTNMTAVPNVDEYLLSAVAGLKSYPEPGIHWRLSWKSNTNLSGQPRGSRLRLGVGDMVSLVYRVHREMHNGGTLMLSKEVQQMSLETSSYSRHHRVSLVAFIKWLTRVLDVDCQAVCEAVLEKMSDPQLSLEMSRQGLYPPGQNGHPVYNSFEPNLSQQPDSQDYTSHFTIELDSSSQISSIIGHLDVLSTKGRTLLAEKATVEVQKISPFVFEVALGSREVVYLLHFPIPVAKQGGKTRVARTSSYVEIIAPLADFATDEALDDFAILSTLSEARVGPPMCQVTQNIPITLNLPHLNLDVLPILDVSKKEGLRFLSTLVSSTFSTRERKLRERFMDSDPSGLAPSPRMNFKESIFTMFMLASGLQGGQTGLFAINHLDKGGIHMLVFVSALRLDASSASAVLDAAVISFTKDIIDSGELESFLLILRTLEIGTITVDDDELVLWKKALPALAERCRTWSHAPECAYSQPSSTVPLSTEPGHPVLCGCGEGRLPDGFISLPEWEDAARKRATRIAISPAFATPLVEEVVDPAAARDLAASLLRASSGSQEEARCWTCGRTETSSGGGGGGSGSGLRRCMRCRVAMYCSAECQKKDWRKHRMECEETEG